MADHHKQNGVHLEKVIRDPDENVNLKPSNLGKREASTATAILSFLVVILAVICAVFRTSLYHHGQAFWISSGNFTARIWGSFYDYFDGNLAKMGLALHCLTVVQYWLIGGLFLITDLTGRPKFITKYKVQLDDTEIPADKLRRTLWTVFLNHTIYSLPILVGLYYAALWRGCGYTVDELPTFPTFLFQFVVFAIVEEIGFYYSHRLLHHPALYKSIHKMHHEWTAPIGMVTTYAHPVENFISNCLPSITSSLLLGSHLLTFNLWILLAQYTSIVHHSGYHIPLLPSPEFHDYHHLKLLHHPSLYKSVHKIHHEWTAPIGLVSIYSHPFEYFLSSTLPVVLGVVITGSHMLVSSLWISLAVTVSTITHSGYHLPLLPSPEFHDYHHLKFTNNYGVLGILDWLHGTDVNYKKSKQFLRHKTLYSITPISELIPDDPK